MASIVTKTIFINASPEAVFAFLNQGENWQKFSIHNIYALRPTGEGDWHIETPRGPGRLRLKTNATFGIVDHEFIDPREGTWKVPARVVPAGDGAVFMMTLTRPTQMPETAFRDGMTKLDEELATLKQLIEQ